MDERPIERNPILGDRRYAGPLGIALAIMGGLAIVGVLIAFVVPIALVLLCLATNCQIG